MQTEGKAQLSLCMIVRNEADILRTFLEHARDLWDELVVVDTGSDDDSVRILEQAGARVLHHPWNDDFAEARNVALAHATGEWALTLDADEFIDEQLKVEIRAVLDDDRIGAGTITLRNRLPYGHVHEAALLRLFRRDPTVRYRYAIHEEVASSLGPYLARTGRRVARLRGVVEHQGYVRTRAGQRDKKQRDLRILERCLQDNPHDLYSHYKRLEVARFWGDRPLWQAAATDAARVLEVSPDDALAGQHHAGELLVLIAQGMYAQEEGLRYVEAHMHRVPPSAELQVFRGQAHEVAGRSQQAWDAYEQALRVDGVHNLQMSKVRPTMGLCRLLMARGDAAQAHRYATSALDAAPRDPEALLAQCSLHLQDSPEAATRFVAEHEAAHGPSPELWMAYGNAAMLQGKAPAAVGAYQQAARLSGERRPLLHAGKAQVRAGDWTGARQTLLPLVEALPEAGIGVLVCEMCLDQDSRLELELQEDEASEMMREWLVTALFGADDNALQNLAKRVPTVQHVFPWLPEALGLAA